MKRSAERTLRDFAILLAVLVTAWHPALAGVRLEIVSSHFTPSGEAG